MELRQLEYLVAVAEEESFTKAAARVYVTQPCVSAQIRRLERELGQELLDRSGRVVQLTEAGAAALPYARAVLAALTSVREAVDDVTGLVRGPVAVGSVASSLSLRLPDIIADFSERYPAVDISLTEGGTGQLLEDVRTGRVDVAIVGARKDPPTGLDVRIIASEALVGAVSHDHPLAKAGKPASVSIDELDGLPLMCMSTDSSVRTAVDAAWAEAGVSPRITFEAGDPQILARLAIRGLGVAILPEPFVRAHEDRLCPIEIRCSQLRGRLALVCRDGGPTSSSARLFAQHAREALTRV